jgi:hypothetical protein
MITTAQIHYAIPNSDGSQRYTYDNSFKQLPAGVTRRKNGESKPFSVEVHDGRTLSKPQSLMRNGYCLARDFDTALDLQNDGLDSEKIVHTYYPEIRRLVTAALGGADTVKRAIVFDHTIRSRVRKAKGEKETNGENVGGYASTAHNDNTSASAKNRVRLLSQAKKAGGSLTLPKPPLTEREAEKIASGRFGIFNVWRHFRKDSPVLDYPLAVLDAQSACPEDFLNSLYIYPDRVGEVVTVVRNPEHRWIYYSEIRHNEALIFKVFDSSAELGACTAEQCPPNTAHTSFRLADSDASTPARESIECRVLVEFVVSGSGQ